MNILAIETATAYCSVALETPQGLISRFESTNRLHAQRLLPMVDELLSEAKLSLPQIDAIAISIGPGSFTGLRIGSGVVQGLAFAHQIPVIPVSTLAVIAQGAIRLLKMEDMSIHVILDAHMQEYFYGTYQKKDGLAIALQQDQLISADIEALNFFHEKEEERRGGCYLLTDINAAISNQSTKMIKLQDLQLPSAVDVIPLAKKSLNKIDAIHLQPTYLRTENAWKKQI